MRKLGRPVRLLSFCRHELVTASLYCMVRCHCTGDGELLPELSAWDALRAALPVGTVSGAPKVRAMQLIDQLEPTRRGPYSGGIGYASFSGNLDFALALRTMVFPTSSAARHDTLYRSFPKGRRQEWIAHLQAGASAASPLHASTARAFCGSAYTTVLYSNHAQANLQVSGVELRVPCSLLEEHHGVVPDKHLRHGSWVCRLWGMANGCANLCCHHMTCRGWHCGGQRPQDGVRGNSEQGSRPWKSH